MKISRKAATGQKGQALIMAMVFLLALTFLGFGLITIATIDNKSSRNLRVAEQVLGAAEQGVLMCMAWAGENRTGFYLKTEGEFDDVRSSNHLQPLIITEIRSPKDRLQFECRVTMGRITETPSGEEIGKAIFRQVQIQSTGYVSETIRGIDFTWGNAPTVRRDLVVQAVIKSPIED